jgi:hypothetical protein
LRASLDAAIVDMPAAATLIMRRPTRGKHSHQFSQVVGENQTPMFAQDAHLMASRNSIAMV